MNKDSVFYEILFIGGIWDGEIVEVNQFPPVIRVPFLSAKSKEDLALLKTETKIAVYKRLADTPNYIFVNTEEENVKSND